MSSSMLGYGLGWLIGLSSSLTLGIPLGIPPLPEDPLLARAAPAECLAYFASSGVATPNPKAESPTERLLAEPQVRRLLTAIEREIAKAIRHKAASQGPQAEETASDAITAARAAFLRPFAVFLTNVTIGPGQPNLDAGAVVALGPQAPAIRSIIEKYQRRLPPGMLSTATVGGHSWQRAQIRPGRPPILWRFQETYLWVAIGEKEAEAFSRRLQGSAPNWLTAIASRLPVKARSTVAYVNLKVLRERFLPLAGLQGLRIALALGLHTVRDLTGITGLDSEGCVNRWQVSIEGPPAGIFAALAGKPLAAADLAGVPADATFAAALRMDSAQLYRQILSIARGLLPEAGRRAEQVEAEIRQRLEVDLRRDILDALGDTWRVYNAPSEGGFIFTGMTAVVSVRDPATLGRSLDWLRQKLGESLQQQSPTGRSEPQVRQTAFGKHTIYYLDAPSENVFVAPAWCLAGHELVLGLFPQAVTAWLGHSSRTPSLAGLPLVATNLTATPSQYAVYTDTAALFRLVYPLAQFGLHIAGGELRRQGIDVDVGLLPSADVVLRHLRPGWLQVAAGRDGIEVLQRQTMPTMPPAILPMSAFVLLPTMIDARSAARQTQSANNLRQLVLAMVVYESEHATLPVGYSADKAGKPLLSWRVHILPMLEQQALYAKFRLNEPWDSPHNKALITEMPVVFRSPASMAPPGRTRYLGVGGPKGIFPGAKAVALKDILDGTANTIAVVEVDDAHAVPWTKPEDFVPDPDQPARGLAVAAGRGYTVGFCDGSVRVLPTSISAKTLNAYFTRDGGEVIEH